MDGIYVDFSKKKGKLELKGYRSFDLIVLFEDSFKVLFIGCAEILHKSTAQNRCTDIMNLLHLTV